MLRAPDAGPHPENKDPETEPVAYPHTRVILATPKTFETTAVKEVPEPAALLQLMLLSDFHR